MTQPHAALATSIGRNTEAQDLVTLRLDACFRATLDPHLAATDTGVAPLGLHWCLAPEIADAAHLGPDGHPTRGDFLPPVPLPRRMWAGGEVEILAPLRIGDSVRRRSRVEGVSWKQGKTGSLCFVSIQHEIDNQAGLAIRELQTLVYREAQPAQPGSRPTAAITAPPLDNQASLVRIDEVLLFRYSALTFNGHRIHYDAPYACKTEGYDGLVVHGPLQATLLLNHAAKVFGRAPSRFTFRNVSAAVGAQTVGIMASPSAAHGLDLRIVSATGAVTMQASATWH